MGKTPPANPFAPLIVVFFKEQKPLFISWASNRNSMGIQLEFHAHEISFLCRCDSVFLPCYLNTLIIRKIQTLERNASGNGLIV